MPNFIVLQDTAGSERYESMSRIYYRGARAAIVCYDLTESSSFDRAKFWVRELQMNEEVCIVHVYLTEFHMFTPLLLLRVIFLN